MLQLGRSTQKSAPNGSITCSAGWCHRRPLDGKCVWTKHVGAHETLSRRTGSPILDKSFHPEGEGTLMVGSRLLLLSSGHSGLAESPGASVQRTLELGEFLGLLRSRHAWPRSSPGWARATARPRRLFALGATSVRAECALPV